MSKEMTLTPFSEARTWIGCGGGCGGIGGGGGGGSQLNFNFSDVCVDTACIERCVTNKTGIVPSTATRTTGATTDAAVTGSMLQPQYNCTWNVTELGEVTCSATMLTTDTGTSTEHVTTCKFSMYS